MKKQNQKGEMVIYQGWHKDIQIQVTLENETIWLSQAQLAQLFSIERSVITKHLRNIFSSHELLEKSNVQKMHIANSDKSVKFYSLDAIISLGYRVNSKRATQFRIWATSVLRDHILKGYTINEKRLKENQTIKLKELEKAISLFRGVIQSKEFQVGESKGLLSVITDYAYSWILLQQYDAGKLAIKKGQTKGISYISTEESVGAVVALKVHVQKKKEGSDIFGVQRQAGALEGILNSIRQSFGGKELYPSLEEKAAHLLYFIIKQHIFIDGNKRVASLLFIFFLSKNQYLYRKNGERKINDNALVALALLIAESKPSEKEVMVSLVTNLLAGE